MMVFQGGQDALVIGYVKKKNVYGGSMGFLGSIPPKFEYVDIIKDLE